MTYPELLRTTLDQGLPIERGLEYLRSHGASPMEAALAVQQVTGAPFERARELVAQSRAWEGPRSLALPAPARDGAVGQHGRSGHGAASVLPHLVRQGAAGR